MASILSDSAKLAALRLNRSYFLRGNNLFAPERLPIAAYSDRLPDHYSGFDRRLYAMFNCSVLPTILRNFDRLSMAHGVEVRMPFMDWRLVTYALALPGSRSRNRFLLKPNPPSCPWCPTSTPCVGCSSPWR